MCFDDLRVHCRENTVDPQGLTCWDYRKGHYPRGAAICTLRNVTSNTSQTDVQTSWASFLDATAVVLSLFGWASVYRAHGVALFRVVCSPTHLRCTTHPPVRSEPVCPFGSVIASCMLCECGSTYIHSVNGSTHINSVNENAAIRKIMCDFSVQSSVERAPRQREVMCLATFPISFHRARAHIHSFSAPATVTRRPLRGESMLLVTLAAYSLVWQPSGHIDGAPTGLQSFGRRAAVFGGMAGAFHAIGGVGRNA